MPLSLQLDLMPVEEKVPDAPPPKTMVVRYGFLREIGEFPSDITGKVGCGTKVVIRSDRGTEIGEMLTTVCGNGGCSKSITRDKLLSYIENSGGRDYPFTEQGRVLRAATTQDLAEQAKLDEQHHKHLTLARELVAQHRLQMKVVDVEHILGGERVLFYFVAEQRVDFRSLVRDLAHALHTRIELRQVGARDEARLTADYEKCGQHCCCKQFLKVLTPISMRAAKVQKATLDPTKISGRCGRLMCCLRYEDETYEELRKKLPKRNTRVKTEKADGWVIDGQILTQLVLVQFDDGKREAVPMEKILGFDQPKPVGPDGRVMQTPNDRPMMEAPPPRGGPRSNGPNGGPPAAPPAMRERPKPGAPAQAPAGDPWATNGPTGGDLNVRDEIDDLIADAMDDAPAPTAAAPAPTPTQDAPPTSDEQSAPPAEGPTPPPGPMGQNAPGQNVPRINKPFPPRQGQPGAHRQSFKPGPQRPFQGPRPPNRDPQQGFRPPNQQGNIPQTPSAPSTPAPEAQLQPPMPPVEPPAPPAPPQQKPETGDNPVS